MTIHTSKSPLSINKVPIQHWYYAIWKSGSKQEPESCCVFKDPPRLFRGVLVLAWVSVSTTFNIFFISFPHKHFPWQHYFQKKRQPNCASNANAAMRLLTLLFYLFSLPAYSAPLCTPHKVGFVPIATDLGYPGPSSHVTGEPSAPPCLGCVYW